MLEKEFELDKCFFDKFDKHISAYKKELESLREELELISNKNYKNSKNSKDYKDYISNELNECINCHIVDSKIKVNNPIFKNSTLSDSELNRYLSIYKDKILYFQNLDIYYNMYFEPVEDWIESIDLLKLNDFKIIFNSLIRYINKIFFNDFENDKLILKMVFNEDLVTDFEENLKIRCNYYFPYFYDLIWDKYYNSSNYYNFLYKLKNIKLNKCDECGKLSFRINYFETTVDYTRDEYRHYIPLFLEKYSFDDLSKISKYLKDFIYIRTIFYKINIEIDFNFLELLIDLNFDVSYEEIIKLKKFYKVLCIDLDNYMLDKILNFNV